MYRILFPLFTLLSSYVLSKKRSAPFPKDLNNRVNWIIFNSLYLLLDYHCSNTFVLNSSILTSTVIVFNKIHVHKVWNVTHLLPTYNLYEPIRLTLVFLFVHLFIYLFKSLCMLWIMVLEIYYMTSRPVTEVAILAMHLESFHTRLSFFLFF